MKNSYYTITQREIDILNILWNSNESLTASQIVNSRPDLTTNTVQAVLRKLLKNSFIKIDKIVYSGTVLSRSYCPAISQEAFMANQFRIQMQNINEKMGISDFVAAFLDEETDTSITKTEIKELEQMLADYKQKIKEKDKC